MNYRKLLDRITFRLMHLASLSVVVVLLLIVAGLYLKSLPILKTKSLTQILFSQDWHPLKGEFGLLPFIAGTAWVTVLAGLIALPLSLLTAIYLAEFAPSRIRGFFKPVMDILAGIPSVVYGLWGVLFLSFSALANT